jgi:Putative peptidoglycan binding domain
VVAVTVEAAAFAAVAFAVAVGFTVALTAVAFVMVAFAAAGSTIATSTIDSSSLAILGTRSFTIPIHTTDTIPTAIILMVTDTVALAAAAFVVAGLVAAAFAAVAFAAVGDPYNQPVYQGSPGYTDQLVEQIQLRLALAGYYHGSIDGVSGNGTRRAIREYKRAHGLPEDGKIGPQLLMTMGLS